MLGLGLPVYSDCCVLTTVLLKLLEIGLPKKIFFLSVCRNSYLALLSLYKVFVGRGNVLGFVYLVGA
jgi:hypothetical protein